MQESEQKINAINQKKGDNTMGKTTLEFDVLMDFKLKENNGADVFECRPVTSINSRIYNLENDIAFKNEVTILQLTHLLDKKYEKDCDPIEILNRFEQFILENREDVKPKTDEIRSLRDKEINIYKRITG